MIKSIKLGLTSKWLLVVQEYELVRQKRSKNFKTVEQICQAYKVHRKDIRKYYERWIKSGKDMEALLPQKRGPKPGQLKTLTNDEERTIVKIQRRLPANGKIERFWKILYDECTRLQTITLSKEDFIAELNGFMYRYNYLRKYGGLNYLTPLNKLKSVTEIMK